MLDENYIVEKSKPLVWAQFRDYGPGELKILDTYLSRINARDPDSALVVFTKKEYANLMGIDPDVRTDQLKAYTRNLLSNVVTIDLPGEGYVQYPLFSEAKCYKDKDLGQVAIKIECNEKLKAAFFSIAEDGYVKYALKNVIALKSQFSMRLYPRLKDRPFGWTVEVDELRELLGANTASYQEFKIFNRGVIQKAVSEINEVTDIIVTTENIRRGRSVASIKFTVRQKTVPLPASDREDAEPEIIIPGEVIDIPAPDDDIAFYSTAVHNEFTRTQVQALVALAEPHVPYDLSIVTLDDKKMWIHDYIDSKYRMMKADPDVKKPYAWLKSAIANDYQIGRR